MLLLLIMVVMVVLGIKLRSLLVSAELIYLFNCCEESAIRLAASQMRTDKLEEAKELFKRFSESNEVVWLNNVCSVTGGSTRVRVLKTSGLVAVIKNCITNEVDLVNIEDLFDALVK